MKLGKLLFVALTCGFVESLVAADQVTRRPISDFLSQQGTFCIDDGAGGCFLFVPPVKNFLGWADSHRGVVGVAASIDYAGLASQYLRANGVDIGTQITGTIIERALPNGLASVSVTLKTRNALTWVVPGTDFTVPPVFGVKAPEVVLGAKPALANVEFRITFINPAGAALPDLMQLFFFAPASIVNYAFQASGNGLFCDGSRGSVNVSQTGNAHRSNIQAAIVNLHGPVPPCL